MISINFLKDKRFQKIIILALFYTGLSLSYSLIGLIHPVPPEPPSEYTPSRLVIELGGHFVFGFVAALPLFDIQLSVLTGGLAVLIDSDHIFGALQIPITGRPDHSILYAFVSLIALVCVGKALRLNSSTLIKLAFIGPITVLTHISYDVFAGTGPSFPLLVPFDFNLVTLPFYSWYVLEVSALITSFAAFWVARRYRNHAKEREEDKNIEERAPDRLGSQPNRKVDHIIPS